MGDFVGPPLSQGWARKPPRGKTFGATYIREFQDSIEEMYQRGNVDKSAAQVGNVDKSAAQVAEQLKQKQPALIPASVLMGCPKLL